MTITRTRKEDLELAAIFSQRMRRRLGEELISITLFGSRARGDAKDGSDFDFIVQVANQNDVIRGMITELEVEMMDEFNQLFTTLVFNPEQWRMESQMPLGWNVAREGLSL